MPIVFVDEDDEESSFCDDCDALLFQKRDGSLICTNGECRKEYLPDSVTKHKRKLSPDKSRHSDDGPIAVAMGEYGTYTKKKKLTILDREEKAFIAQGKGRSIIDIQEYLPDSDQKKT